MTVEKMREEIVEIKKRMYLEDTTEIKYEVYSKVDKRDNTYYNDYEKALEEIEKSNDTKSLCMHIADKNMKNNVVNIDFEKDER